MPCLSLCVHPLPCFASFCLVLPYAIACLASCHFYVPCILPVYLTCCPLQRIRGSFCLARVCCLSILDSKPTCVHSNHLLSPTLLYPPSLYLALPHAIHCPAPYHRFHVPCILRFYLVFCSLPLVASSFSVALVSFLLTKYTKPI